MQYSIVVPAFNKAGLTRNCLRTLHETLAQLPDGEVIVIDNASSDDTPQMLAEFPWVRAVRNERNTGFAAANNQGARLARGEFLVLLNNDTEPHPGWLQAMLAAARQPNVGAVGARLLFPDGTIQHAGVAVRADRNGLTGFLPFHVQYGVGGSHPSVMQRDDFQVVTGACLLTPRELYLSSGGLDETFWNGYEDVDYCFRLRALGMRVVYEPGAVLTHFESQSGPQRFRKVGWNVAALAHRWNGKVRFDANERLIRLGYVGRSVRASRGRSIATMLELPKTTVIVHGPDRRGDKAFLAALRANAAPVSSVTFASREASIHAVRAEMEVRGDRYLALVDSRCDLRPGWLDELVRQVSFAPTTAAATYAPELPGGEDVRALGADARCTLLHLAQLPQHLRLDDFDTLDGAVADLLMRALDVRAGVRGAAFALGDVPPCAQDERFAQRHGCTLEQMYEAGPEQFERAFAQSGTRRAGLVSIVMLSWNAPQFTKMALESIRAHTSGEYEVIIVDNGSGAETVEWLRTLEEPVRVIYNAKNRGFAGGNNQALAAARGEYVVLLNNDVIVTDGWLDGLLGAFERIPGLGVSAPRSNKIAGDQIVTDASYADIPQMHEYAAVRRARYRDQGYVTDRAIGLCLCIDRRTIDEIGGIDERFGVGNFEDDDFCLRVRAAGYQIFVCDDVFVHHFGSQTFAANKVDWTATMRTNWQAFAAKWQLPPNQENGGYASGPAIARGFDRARHYVPLPAQPEPAVAASAQYDVVFTAVVRSEDEWQAAGAFARRFAKAFKADAAVLLAIAALGEPDARAIGDRLERFARRESIDLDAVADIEVADAADEASWLATLPQGARTAVDAVDARSPSDLRRFVEALRA